MAVAGGTAGGGGVRLLPRHELRASPAVVGRITDVINDYLTAAAATLQLGDGDGVKRMRERWRSTCRTWHTITNGEKVDYSAEVPLHYACGTTPINAMLFAQVLESSGALSATAAGSMLERRSHGSLRAVLLCGGSGAELIGLVHALDDAIRQTEAAATSAGDDAGQQERRAVPSIKLHVTVVDHVPEWQPCIEHYARALQQRYTSIDLDVRFVCCDLLTASWPGMAQGLLSGAHLVSMMYAMSELYDCDSAKAARAMEAVFRGMQPDAHFVLVEPLSLHTAAKQRWCADLARAAGCPAAQAWEAKIQLAASSFDGTPLQTWIGAFGLRVGHDVKIFANCMVQHYRRASGPAPVPVRAGTAAAGRRTGSTVHRPSKRKAVCSDAADEGAGAEVADGAPAPTPVSVPVPTPAPRVDAPDRAAPNAHAAGSAPPFKVLVVVPDMLSNTWMAHWATSPYPVYRITGIDGSKFEQAWARIAKQAALWEQAGGVLLIDFGRLVQVLGNTHADAPPAVKSTQDSITNVHLLLVDAVQKAHWQFRGPKRHKVRVADMIVRRLSFYPAVLLLCCPHL